MKTEREVTYHTGESEIVLVEEVWFSRPSMRHNNDRDVRSTAAGTHHANAE